MVLATKEPVDTVIVVGFNHISFYEPDPGKSGWIVEILSKDGKMQLESKEFPEDIKHFGPIDKWLCEQLGDSVMESPGSNIRLSWNKALVAYRRR